jgi:hypothetical protein
MIVARVVEPAAKLATARQLSDATASHALGVLLGLGEVDADELYEALDRLQVAQQDIEQALAKRHLKDGVLVLYDVSSSYLEGEHGHVRQAGVDSRCNGSADLRLGFDGSDAFRVTNGTSDGAAPAIAAVKSGAVGAPLRGCGT